MDKSRNPKSPTRNNAEQRWDILVVGLPEAGKSTLLKQAKILYQYKLKSEQRREYLFSICSTIYAALKKEMGKQFDSNQLAPTVNHLYVSTRQRNHDGYEMPARFDNEQKLLSHLVTLWNELPKSSKVDTSKFNESEAYFWKRVGGLVGHSESYVPTDQDILKSEHDLSLGVHEFNFVENGLKMRLVVIGNQETNWRKFIHYFEKALAVIFLADASCFNQSPRNPEYINRFEETLAFYQEISYTKWLGDAKLVLVLNKMDVLEQLLLSDQSDEFFADYSATDGKTMRHSLQGFVQEKFHQVDHRYQASGSACYLCTCLLEPRDVEHVMQTVGQWRLDNSQSTSKFW